MNISRWKIFMRQYQSRLNIRSREKEVTKMTPTFLMCMKGWKMAPFSDTEYPRKQRLVGHEFCFEHAEFEAFCSIPLEIANKQLDV